MTDFEARMTALQARFVSRAIQDAADLDRLASAGDWNVVRDLAHGLAGRAGMFGHHPIGDIARIVEEDIEAGREPVDRVADLVARLRALDQGR